MQTSCLGMHFDVKSWESSRSATLEMGVIHNDASGLPYEGMQMKTMLNHVDFFMKFLRNTPSPQTGLSRQVGWAPIKVEIVFSFVIFERHLK